VEAKAIKEFDKKRNEIKPNNNRIEIGKLINSGFAVPKV
jgi:hypothetical protein